MTKRREVIVLLLTSHICHVRPRDLNRDVCIRVKFRMPCPSKDLLDLQLSGETTVMLRCRSCDYAFSKISIDGSRRLLKQQDSIRDQGESAMLQYCCLVAARDRKKDNRQASEEPNLAILCWLRNPDICGKIEMMV